MRVRVGRFAVLLSVLALSSRHARRRRRVHRPVFGCRRVGVAVGRSLRIGKAPPTPLPVTESQAKPGDVVIRWYCCLGTGDAPEQVEVERKVADDFNASHPGIHLQFEGFVYAAATDALSVQIGSGSGPDVVGPVGGVARSGSRASGWTCSRTSIRLAST